MFDSSGFNQIFWLKQAKTSVKWHFHNSKKRSVRPVIYERRTCPYLSTFSEIFQGLRPQTPPTARSARFTHLAHIHTPKNYGLDPSLVKIQSLIGLIRQLSSEQYFCKSVISPIHTLICGVDFVTQTLLSQDISANWFNCQLFK